MVYTNPAIFILFIVVVFLLAAWKHPGLGITWLACVTLICFFH
jgi:hypothetical protein